MNNARVTIAILLTLLTLLTLVPGGRVLAQYQDTVVGRVYHDTNCDGMYQDGEPPVIIGGQGVVAYAAGDDGVYHTLDDIQIDILGQRADGTIWLSRGNARNHARFTILSNDQPAGFEPAPLKRDVPGGNFLDRPVPGYPRYWSTDKVQLGDPGVPVTMNLGLCTVGQNPPNWATVWLPLIIR